MKETPSLERALVNHIRTNHPLINRPKSNATASH
jgi:hypothetical protein